MKFPIRIALRYFFTKRSFHFITIITYISIIGIVAGVAALIIIMAIFNGFSEFTEQQLIGYDPHLRVKAREGTYIGNPEELTSRLRNIKEIKAVTSLLQGRMVAINGKIMQVIVLNAVKPSEIGSVSGIASRVLAGSFELKKQGSHAPLIIGSGLTDRLKVLTKDSIVIYSPAMIESSVRTFSKQNGVPVFVSGIFQTNAKEFDAQNAYINYDYASDLFRFPKDAVSSIDIKLFDIADCQRVKDRIRSIVPETVEVLSWYDLHKELLNIMKFERMVAFVVLSLIIMIAVFNVLAALSMTVVEKHSDIGLLMALGAGKEQILSIYLVLGLMIGVVSTILGTLVGIGFCFGQTTFHWFSLDTSKFLINAIPVSLHTRDVLIIIIFSILMSFLATIFPARRASSVNIIQAIREE